MMFQGLRYCALLMILLVMIGGLYACKRSGRPSARSTGFTTEEPTKSDWLTTKHWTRDNLPTIAILEHSRFRGSKSPISVSVAVWPDGRVEYMPSGVLCSASVEPARVDQLLADIAATGVFDLPSSSYSVVDATLKEMYFRNDQKMIAHQWDEVTMDDYGYNVDPTPGYRQFTKVWGSAHDVIDRFIAEIMLSQN